MTRSKIFDFSRLQINGEQLKNFQFRLSKLAFYVLFFFTICTIFYPFLFRLDRFCPRRSVTKIREAPSRHRTFISDGAVPLAINHYEIFAPRYCLFNYSKKPRTSRYKLLLTLFPNRTFVESENIFCNAIKNRELSFVSYLSTIKNTSQRMESIEK